PSSKEFFRHYFEAGLFNREIYAIAQEGARNHGLLNVSVTDFFNTKLHIPEPADKEAIEKVINTAEQELHNFEAQLDSLQSQKKALMQQLLTGKRRVKIDAAEARRA
ncbi:MAG TPA: restriction endonuclease subunit S, partial [Gammaproteobacteria bacterium]